MVITTNTGTSIGFERSQKFIATPKPAKQNKAPIRNAVFFFTFPIDVFSTFAYSHGIALGAF